MEVDLSTAGPAKVGRRDRGGQRRRRSPGRTASSGWWSSTPACRDRVRVPPVRRRARRRPKPPTDRPSRGARSRTGCRPRSSTAHGPTPLVECDVDVPPRRSSRGSRPLTRAVDPRRPRLDDRDRPGGRGGSDLRLADRAVRRHHALPGVDRRRAAVEVHPVEHTDVHRFDIATSGPAVYQALRSGRRQRAQPVRAERARGHLRIATTTSPTGLRRARDRLRVAGTSRQRSTAELAGDRADDVRAIASSRPARSSGLGPTEQIQGVRFMGDRGYVVTFRQTDPLYVIDLADPAAPKVLGELKVTGFSDYLHPVGARDCSASGSRPARRAVSRAPRSRSTTPATRHQPAGARQARLCRAAGSTPAAIRTPSRGTPSTPPPRSSAPGTQPGAAASRWAVPWWSGSRVIRLVEVGRLVHDAEGHPCHDGAPTDDDHDGAADDHDDDRVADHDDRSEATTTTVVDVPTTIAPEDDDSRSLRAEASSSDGARPPAAPDPGPADRDLPVDVDRSPESRSCRSSARCWPAAGCGRCRSLGPLGHDPVTRAEVAWTELVLMRCPTAS